MNQGFEKGSSKRSIRIKIILLREETSDKLKTIKVSAIKYQQIKPYCDKYNSMLLKKNKYWPVS